MAPCEVASLEELETRMTSLVNGCISATEVRLTGVRVVHKQRLGKGLVFLGLRAANGRLIEAVLRVGVLEVPAELECTPPARLSAVCPLGDCVAVTGLVECSKGRLSILARTLETQEAWAALFGARATFRDDVVHGKGLPRGLWPAPPLQPQPTVLLLQVVSSHAQRTGEYLQATHGVPSLATVAPISSPGFSRDERCLVVQTASAPSLVRCVLADPTVARFVQRWCVRSRADRSDGREII